jgi:glycosyltransferase involved in cell wall biosynthesis
VSAIPELLREGATGVLVEENDAASLASAIEDLIANPARRRALGAAGQARVRAEFGLERNLDRLAAKFELGAEAGTHAHRLLRSA